MHPVQRAFHAEHGLQCGFCTPGMVMALVSLLRENPHPTEDIARARGQPVPLHRLPQHRPGRRRRPRGGHADTSGYSRRLQLRRPNRPTRDRAAGAERGDDAKFLAGRHCCSAHSSLEVRAGLEGNLCRCTGYHNIVRAALTAAAEN